MTVVILRCYCLVILDTTAAPGVFLICYQSKPGLIRGFSLVSAAYSSTVPGWPLSLKLGIFLCPCGSAVPTRTLPNWEFRAAADFFVTWLDLEESFLFQEQQQLPSTKSCATSTLAKDIWLPVLWSVHQLPAFFVFCWERRQFPLFLLSGRKGFRIH